MNIIDVQSNGSYYESDGGANNDHDNHAGFTPIKQEAEGEDEEQYEEQDEEEEDEDEHGEEGKSNESMDDASEASESAILAPNKKASRSVDSIASF